jgi:hypothetical protein
VSESRMLVEKYTCNTCSIPNKSKIIAAAVKVATTVRTGKMIADNDSPIAKAPMPICRALTWIYYAGIYASSL